MASFLGAASRLGIKNVGGLVSLATAASVASSSFPLYHWSQCDAAAESNDAPATGSNASSPPKISTKNLKKRMTLIGRFSLESETLQNPSIPTFFVALAGNGAFDAANFAQLWHDRGMEAKHPRFHHKIFEGRYFEPMEEEMDIQDAMPFSIYREDLKQRIQHCLTHPLSVEESLWQVQIASGAMGSSGAIPRNKAAHSKPEYKQESVLLFRGHHALADGVSLTAAFGDLTDEAHELREAVNVEVAKRLRGPSRSFWQKLKLYLKRLLWLCGGSIRAVWNHVYLLLFTPANPFDALKAALLVENENEEEEQARRTLSWCEAAPLDQVKEVARAMGSNVTVNDVMVSCVTYAVARQLQQHRQHLHQVFPENTSLHDVHRTINVVIPVHLQGGVLLPGQSVGNKIGAFCARVPGEMPVENAEQRLRDVHESLFRAKSTPAPLLSFCFAKIVSVLPLPSSLTTRMFQSSQAHACVAITNNRGSPRKLHFRGQPIIATAGFLPLPLGIPIGVSIASYAGTVSLSVTAEPWAVPDADLFLTWMLEEYHRLLVLRDNETNNKES